MRGIHNTENEPLSLSLSSLFSSQIWGQRFSLGSAWPPAWLTSQSRNDRHPRESQCSPCDTLQAPHKPQVCVCVCESEEKIINKGPEICTEGGGGTGLRVTRVSSIYIYMTRKLNIKIIVCVCVCVCSIYVCVCVCWLSKVGGNYTLLVYFIWKIKIFTNLTQKCTKTTPMSGDN